MTFTDDKPLSLVHILSNRIGRAFHNKIEARFGLSLVEWRVLTAIASEPGITASEITSRWALEKMSVNRAIRHLHKQGRLTRTRDSTDGRSYRLRLTAKGAALHADVAPVAAARCNELTSVLSEAETTALMRALRKLLERAEALHATATSANRESGA